MDAPILMKAATEKFSSEFLENTTQLITTTGGSKKDDASSSRTNGESYFEYIFLVFSTFGLIGNTLTLVVIFRNITKSLNFMIACMLISDMLYIIFSVISNLNLFSVKIPFQWTFGISGGCAAMIGIERAIVIKQPFWFRQNWTIRITIAAIISIIITNISIDIVSYLLPEDVKEGSVLPINITKQILGRYLPCIVVTLTNILIGIELYKYARNMVKLSGENSPTIRQTSTVFPVTLIYIICTLPTCIILLVKSGIVSESSLGDFVWVTRYLTLFNASSNFYLYVLGSKHLRDKFLSIFCNCCQE